MQIGKGDRDAAITPLRYLEVDENRGSQDPKALKEISQHMHKGSPDTGVSQGHWVSMPLL